MEVRRQAAAPKAVPRHRTPKALRPYRGSGRRAARPVRARECALGTVHVDVSVHSTLLRAARLTAEVYPAVRTVKLEIERPAVRLERLSVTAPAVEETVWPGGDPLVVAHKIQNRLTRPN